MEKNDFANHLSTLDLEVLDVERDGNCFFHAISDQLNHEADHLKLRELATNQLEKHKSYYKDLVPDEDIEKHIEKLKKVGNYADHLDILAISDSLN